MPLRLIVVARICTGVLQAALLGCLIYWAIAAPLVWILRDGLGPDMAETTGFRAVQKFMIGWGLPAFLLAAPQAGLWLLGGCLDRAWARREEDPQANTGKGTP